MARINICGFETSDFTEGTIVGTASVQGTIKRSGNYALRCNPTTTNTGAIQINGISATTGAAANYNTATIYARFYVRFATLPASGSEEIFQPRDTGGSMKGALGAANSGWKVSFDGTNATVEAPYSAAVAAGYKLQVLTANDFRGTFDVVKRTYGLRRRMMLQSG